MWLIIFFKTEVPIKDAIIEEGMPSSGQVGVFISIVLVGNVLIFEGLLPLGPRTLLEDLLSIYCSGWLFYFAPFTFILKTD